MKRFLPNKNGFFVLLLGILLSAAGLTKLQAQNITFADANVKDLCVANWDTDGDGELSYAEAAAVTNLGGVFIEKSAIVSFDELQYFTGLTSIGNYAFADCYHLTSIVIPNSVTSIGNHAFGSCTDLTSIGFPNSVTSIGNAAFFDCHSLTTLTIPYSVTSIGTNPFTSCNGLNQIVVDSGNTVYDSRENCNAIIKTSTNELVTGCKNTVVPNSVTSIGDYAFHYCFGLTSIAIPNSVTSIGDYAFSYCSSLVSITVLAETPPSMSAHTFFYVDKSTPVYVPNGSVSAYQAASGWSEFTNIQELGTLPISFADANVKALCVTNWDTDSDGELSYAEAAAVTSLGEVFRNNSSISSFEELQYFVGLSAIGNFAFYRCTGLTTVEIPNSVTSIGEYSFYNCTSLTSIELPNSVTSIRNYSFSVCTSLTSIALSNSLTSIYYYSFAGCRSLTSIEIPSSVTYISSDAFPSCSGLEQIIVDSGNTVYDSRENCNAIIKTSTNVLAVGCKNTIIPNTVTSIGNNAFYGCKNLLSIEIPNSVTSIGSSAFIGSGLVSIEIPNSVTSIGSAAFSSCNSLLSVEIPNSITSMGSNAFSGCINLSSVTVLADTPPTANNNTFYMVNNEIPVYVPCGSVESYSTINWGGFNNFVGLCGGTVSVAATPEEGGMVTGSGVFEAGESCTVTATENEGYTFALWTRNGTCASIDPEYTFYVSGDMDLVAHFVPDANITFADANVKSVCVNQWDYNGDGELSYVEASLVISLGEVFRDNVTITSFDELQYFIGLTSIDNFAFSGCGNLTSIEIPNSVTSIKNYAFSNCTGLTSITLWVDNPPTLEYYNGVGKYTPIYVPCNATEAYQNADNWMEYKNILGMCSGEVAVVVNPSEGGTVTGAGYYNGGDICVLMATPNPGFSFVNWVEKGVVSADAVYSFHAHATTIIANFCSNNPIVFADSNVKALCVANWDTNGDGELSYAEAAVVTSLDEVFRENADIISFDELQYFIGLTSIGSYAFYYCTGLTSIEIPNAVAEIGSSAFEGCSKLASITVWAETPPVLKDGFEIEEEEEWKDGFIVGSGMAFDGVNKYTPVYVPCNAVEVYQNAESWNEFTNIMGMCSGEVAVTVNPSEGGTVSGAGYYNSGDICVMTATPNAGFGLGNWMENGVMVSTDAVYSFRAHPTTIIANFCSESPIVFADANVKALCVANWDTNGDGELSYVEAAAVSSLGIVFRNNSSISSFDELQYFIGLTSIGPMAFSGCSGLTSIVIPDHVTSIDDYAFKNCTSLTSIVISDAVTSIGYQAFYQCNGLTSIEIPHSVVSIGEYAFDYCRGLTSLTIPNSVTSIGNYAFYYCSNLTSMTVQAETPPTVYSNTFSRCPKNIPVYVPCGSAEAYQSAEYWSEFTNIQESCSQQTISLSQGWNWISLYIEVEDSIEALQMLEAALGDNATVISGSELYTEYYGGGFWIGDLDDVGITNEQMYMIEVVNDCEVMLEGTIVNPANHAITIYPGWNWIGFPSSEELNIEDAFADFEAEDGDQLTEAELYTEYGFGMWIGDVAMLVPGRGYMYFSSSTQPKTLVFPSTSKSKSVSLRKPK